MRADTDPKAETIERAGRPDANGWLAIDYAPMDGTHLLLFGEMVPYERISFTGPVIFSGCWDSIDSAWCSTASTWIGPFFHPTHFQPLPNPPEPSK